MELTIYELSTLVSTMKWIIKLAGIELLLTIIFSCGIKDSIALSNLSFSVMDTNTQLTSTSFEFKWTTAVQFRFFKSFSLCRVGFSRAAFSFLCQGARRGRELSRRTLSKCFFGLDDLLNVRAGLLMAGWLAGLKPEA